MSKVGKYGLIIITPPLKPIFMSKYQKNLGPSNKSWSPFTYCLSIQPRKEAKTQWENPPLNMDRKNKILESCHQSCFTALLAIAISDLGLLNVFSQTILVKMSATCSKDAQKSRTMVQSCTSCLM